MNKKELLQQSDELRRAMQKASGIADRLRDSFNELKQPAIRAQCNVILAFLEESVAHEKLFSDMVNKKIKD